MAYQALYRAWRPKQFSEIFGQDAVVSTLMRQIATDRIAHAYLFCGSRGTGKTSAAKVFARAINCLDHSSPEPCGECEVCRAILGENAMDVVEIDAASNNGVDEIRDLREKIKYPPTLTRYKVYIIDEVHMLSTGAFNALLKTLEEPPAHAVFILATTEPQRLPATILSRCQRFDFHRITVETIVEKLMIVLGGIGRIAESEALYEIARAAEGALRDALSLLDVCLSYTDGEITLQLARDVLGTAGRDFMFDFMDALIGCDAAKAMRLIAQTVDTGRDPQVFARDTMAHARTCMLAGIMGDALTDIAEITPEDCQRFIEQAQRAPREKFMRIMDLFMRAEPDMRWAIQPRTVLELCAVRACHPESEKDATLEERIARVEDALKNGVVSPAPVPAQAPAGTPNVQSKPAVEAKAPVTPKSTVTPDDEYLKAIGELQAGNPALASAANSMRFVGVEGNTVTVEFEKKHMMFMKLLERRTQALEQALTEAYGRQMRVNMRLQGSAAAVKTASSAAKSVIEQSYDIFGRDKIDLTD